MNEANQEVREAARNLVLELLNAVGVQGDDADTQFGEGSTAATLELSLTRFAGAILEQARRAPPSKAIPPSPGAVG
jgi:hypothetical protein